MGCQKVDPQVLSLASGGGSIGESNPRNGRITLGSTDGVLTAGSYKLKGRLTSVESGGDPSGSPGTYKLRGTVRF